MHMVVFLAKSYSPCKGAGFCALVIFGQRIRQMSPKPKTASIIFFSGGRGIC